MYEIIENSNHIFIKPEKNIVESTAGKFKSKIAALIRESPRNLTIDLTHVEMVDSRGIEVIVTMHNILKKKGNNIKVTNTSKELYELFDFLRLNRHFSIEKAC